MTGSSQAEDVELAALRLLVGREHSRQELHHKLVCRRHDPASVDRVLDDLERRRLLSDDRFVENYIHQRIRKGYGPLRIRAELSDRGVADTLTTQGLERAAVDWPGLLLGVAQRRFGAAPAEDRRALAKRARYLQQRGFPADLIGHYLTQVGSP